MYLPNPWAIFLSTALVITFALTCCLASAHDLNSPDGKYQFSIELKDGRPYYQISYDGKPVVQPSRLGFVWADKSIQKIAATELFVSPLQTHQATWKPLYGERSQVEDHYQSKIFTWQTKGAVDVAVEVRCYDQGVAFCYHFQPVDTKQKYVIESERTQFAFADNHITWVAEHAQGEYHQTTVNQLQAAFDRPLIFQDKKHQQFIAIGEARLVDFAAMKLTAANNRSNGVQIKLASKVEFSDRFKSPWRFVMVGDSPGALLENNDLILNLSDPCEIEDTSWIKPGKILREVTLTGEGGMACIDFAAEHGIGYILFDAGWYGDEFDEKSDASTVTIDRKRSDGEIDMQKVIDYGKQKGVGVILYVNRRALEKQLPQILPLYKKWGIAGVKYGFVRVGSQRWTKWLHQAIRMAAEQQLMLDIHDEYRPTGYSRTYPNLMTQEGIGGDETHPSAKMTLGILFPRSLAGAADHTFCYHAKYVDGSVNHAFQLAKTVCFYSPWQVIFWYDRPPGSPEKTGGAGGGDAVLGDEVEIEFFDRLPTVWDDLKVLSGRIQQHAVIARRSGADWYIGAMNGEQKKQFRFQLEFLNTGQTYNLTSYTHDPAMTTRTKVKIEHREVNSKSELLIDLSENDGAAFYITPKK